MYIPINLFLFGMPRSGTKLLRELLNSHEEVFIPVAESNFIPLFFKKYGAVMDFSKSEIRSNIKKDIEKSLFIFYLKNEHQFNIDFKFIEKLEKPMLLSEFMSILFLKFCKKQNIKILGDKTPSYIYHTKILKNLFPTAKFIHIYRDPRDIVISMNKAWGKNIFLAAHEWNETMNYFRTLKESDINLLEIKYEDLIDDPQTVLNKICEYLNINFSEKLLTPNTKPENRGDAKGFNRIKKNNYNKYIDKLTNKDLSTIENILVENLRYYNYPLVNSDLQHSVSPNKLKLKYYRLLDIYAVLKDRIKHYGFKKGISIILISRQQFASKNR